MFDTPPPEAAAGEEVVDLYQIGNVALLEATTRGQGCGSFTDPLPHPRNITSSSDTGGEFEKESVEGISGRGRKWIFLSVFEASATRSFYLYL